MKLTRQQIEENLYKVYIAHPAEKNPLGKRQVFAPDSVDGPVLKYWKVVMPPVELLLEPKTFAEASTAPAAETDLELVTYQKDFWVVDKDGKEVYKSTPSIQ